MKNFPTERLFLLTYCVKLYRKAVFGGKELKFKELKKILALSLAYTLAVPSNVYAADVQVQTENNKTEIENPVSENKEEGTA